MALSKKAQQAYDEVLGLLGRHANRLSKHNYSELLEALICELQASEEALDSEMGEEDCEGG